MTVKDMVQALYDKEIGSSTDDKYLIKYWNFGFIINQDSTSNYINVAVDGYKLVGAGIANGNMGTGGNGCWGWIGCTFDSDSNTVTISRKGSSGDWSWNANYEDSCICFYIKE